MDARLSRLLMVLAAVAAGCGTDRFVRSQSGDAFAGTQPYRKVDRDPGRSNALGIQSLVFEDATGDVAEPFVVRDGDAWHLYYESARREIGLAVGMGPTGPFAPREVAFVASAPWHEGGVGAPSVVVDGQRTVLFHGTASGRIGRAVSTDGGRSFRADPVDPVLVPALPWEGERVDSPSVVVRDGVWWMAYEGVEGIGLARSDDGVSWQRVDGDGGRAGLDPALRVDRSGAWDGEHVGAPCLVLERTSAGRALFRLFFEGRGAREALLGDVLDTSIGEAGSFGPDAWSTFEGNPVLDEVPPLALRVPVYEAQPAVVGPKGARWLYFATREGLGGTVGVGLATDAATPGSVLAASEFPQGN